jgi:hypothetical protein
MKRTILFVALIGATIACKSKTEDSQTDSTQMVSTDSVATASNIPDTGNSYCYLEALNKDSTIVTFTITDDVVEGEMKWLPYEKDGAIGTIKGKKVGDEIKVDFDYVIEGSQQVEEKIFVMKGDELLEKSGELEGKNGKLVMKNPEKATIAATLKRINCLDISHE